MSEPFAPSLGSVGVVGLGQMGLPIAEHLRAAGWTVLGCDVDRARCEAFAGETVVDAAEVGARSDVVVLCLPSPAALRAAVEGLCDGGAPIVLEAGTFALEDKHWALERVRAVGGDVLDCPLSGTAVQARRGDLVAYVSGEETLARRCDAVLAAFARERPFVGPYGHGSRLKFLANHLVAVHDAAAAELFALAGRAGLDREQVLEVALAGAGWSRILELRGPMMASGDYAASGMSGEVLRKDIAVIAAWAQSLGCPTPLLAWAAQLHEAAAAQGRGAEDPAAVCAALERLAGIVR